MNSQQTALNQLQHDCCICFEEIGKTNVTTTPCGHTFCFSCLMKSMDVNNSCPYCRASLRKEDDIIEESDSDDDSDYDSDAESDYELHFNNIDDLSSQETYHWTLNWNEIPSLDNTSNPINGFAKVDDIMEYVEKNNITMRDLISSFFWRYDSTDNRAEIEKKSRDLSQFIYKNEKEKENEWSERMGMMEEDTRRNNRSQTIQDDDFSQSLDKLFH